MKNNGISNENKKRFKVSRVLLMALFVAIFAVVLVGLMGSASAKSLYVNKDINANSPISAYDIQPAPTYLVWQKTSVPTRYGGAGLAIDTDSEILFVTFEGSGVLDIVDAKTLGKLGQVAAPGARNLAGIVVDQDKQKVYTVDRNTNHLYVYSWNAVTKTLTNDITTPPFYVSLPGIYAPGSHGYGLHGIALDETNDILYVCDVTKTVSKFNTAGWASAGTITLTHQRAMAIAVDVSKGLMYTGNSYGPYGSVGYLDKYDLNTNTETFVNIRTLPLGIPSDNVVGIAVDPATSLVYITSGNQGSGGRDRIMVFDSNLNYLYATGDIGNPTGIVVPGKEISYNPLNLAKSDGLAPGVKAGVGDTLTYTVSYDNIPNSYQVTGASIVDTLPSEVSYVSSTGGGVYNAIGHTITWTLGTIPANDAGDSFTVTVTVDSGGGTTIDNAVVIDSDQTPPTTVHEYTEISDNRPPTVTLADSYSGFEGTPVVFTATASDPDGDALTYYWSLDGTTWTSTGSNPTYSYTWPDDATATIYVKVSDGSLEDTDDAPVYISNLNPTADAGGPYTGFEGSAIGFSGFGTDPGADTLTYEWDFSYDGMTFNVEGTGQTPSHTYYDDFHGHVALRVTDDDGGFDIDTAKIDVENVAPEFSPGSFSISMGLAAVGDDVTVSIDFSNPGILDEHDWGIDWGDSNTDSGSMGPSGTGTVTGTHQYAAAGIYDITITVYDDEGASDTYMYANLLVFDPDDGFVTGGGWVDTKMRSYAPDPKMTGKATFGMVCKYKKGDMVPSGNVEFQFHPAKLNFHSTSFDWLIIFGPNAYIQGSGTINGGGDYGFLLTAIDAKLTPNPKGQDMFRMRIWDKATNNVIYDNNMGLPLYDDPTEDLTKGQFMIHK